MRDFKFIVFIVFICSCRDYKIEPAYIKPNFTIDVFENDMYISYSSEHYISHKNFQNSPCFPIISYHSRYFDRKPFFAYREILLNNDSNIVLIDYYGKGIDSLNYEKIEVLFYLNGKQMVKYSKVFILVECYTAGNEAITEIVKGRKLAKIANEWGLIIIE